MTKTVVLIIQAHNMNKKQQNMEDTTIHDQLFSSAPVAMRFNSLAMPSNALSFDLFSPQLPVSSGTSPSAKPSSILFEPSSSGSFNKTEMPFSIASAMPFELSLSGDKTQLWLRLRTHDVAMSITNSLASRRMDPSSAFIGLRFCGTASIECSVTASFPETPFRLLF